MDILKRGFKDPFFPVEGAAVAHLLGSTGPPKMHLNQNSRLVRQLSVLRQHQDQYLGRDESKNFSFRYNMFLVSVCLAFSIPVLQFSYIRELRKNKILSPDSTTVFLRFGLTPLLALTTIYITGNKLKALTNKLSDKYLSNLTDWGLENYTQVQSQHLW